VKAEMPTGAETLSAVVFSTMKTPRPLLPAAASITIVWPPGGEASGSSRGSGERRSDGRSSPSDGTSVWARSSVSVPSLP